MCAQCCACACCSLSCTVQAPSRSHHAACCFPLLTGHVGSALVHAASDCTAVRGVQTLSRQSWAQRPPRRWSRLRAWQTAVRSMSSSPCAGEDQTICPMHLPNMLVLKEQALVQSRGGVLIGVSSLLCWHNMQRPANSVFSTTSGTPAGRSSGTSCSSARLPRTEPRPSALASVRPKSLPIRQPALHIINSTAGIWRAANNGGLVMSLVFASLPVALLFSSGKLYILVSLSLGTRARSGADRCGAG